MTFEHFKSRKALEVETARFLVLADRLGVKVILRKNEVSEGDPFPGEDRNVHMHSHRHGHGDSNDHGHTH